MIPQTGPAPFVPSKSVPSAPYDHVRGPDFERYPPAFDSKKGTGFLELCVPVRRWA